MATSKIRTRWELQGSRRVVIDLLAGLAAIMLVAAVIFGLTAGAGAIWSAVTSNGVTATAAPIALPAGAKVEQIKLEIDPPPLDGVRNPLGEIVDGYVPASFTMTAGDTVEVTVANYDAFPHTWTSPSLGVDASIAPGSPTSPTITRFLIHPKEAGTFAWQCETPCNAWSMSHVGYMKGFVKVVSA
jgi:plastocyanin